MERKLFGICTLILLGAHYHAQERDSIIKKEESAVKVQQIILKNGEVREYPRPKWHEPITNFPKDFMTTNRSFVQNGNVWYLGGAVAATALLVPFDQQIADNSRKLADNLGMTAENKYAKFGPIPKSVGAGLYMIGNGTTVLLLGAGFLTYGLMKNDYRAYATASGLLESLALSGFYVQVLKRSTGRESPFIARENGNSGGAWNPFPSFSAYGKNTPHYDAMPSGHLATIMAGFTVITTNYPDVKWLKPVGYTLIGGLCFQMMQSEVHWASDYPLALLIGYFSGRSIARSHFKKVKNGEDGKPQYSLDVIGGNAYGINTIGVKMSF